MSDANAASNVSLMQRIIITLGIAAAFFAVCTMITGNAVKEAPAPTIDVASNIKPLAEVEVAPDRTNYVDMSGEEVVTKACHACHGTGLPGIPKIGDHAAWQARIAQGYDALVNNAIQGIRMMPARGGNPDLTDLEVARAVVEMANQSGANFTQPQAEAK